MEKIIKEGKVLENILNEIAEENNLNVDEIIYHYTEKRNGLLKKTSTFTVEAITKDELLDYTKEILEELLTNMGLKVNFESKMKEDSIYIKIYSDNNPILIGKGGNTLKALENIVRQRINTEYNIRPLITLDVENYREKQEQRLVRLARQTAKDVYKTKTEAHLDNMNAYDRRIIHNALSNFKGVIAESEGEEPNRHIVIKPE